MQPDGETFVWELEREITEFGIDNLGVRLCRTNDFRIGIIAEKASGNMMAISKRNYTGMSNMPEKLHARVDAEISLRPLVYSTLNCEETLTANFNSQICLFPDVDAKPVGIDRISQTLFAIKFNTTLLNVNTDGLTVTDGAGTLTYTITNISFNTLNKTLEVIIDEDIPELEDIKINYIGGLDRMLVINNGACKFELPSFELLSEGQLPLVQDGYSIEYLKAGFDATIDFLLLIFSDVAVQEILEADFDATIILWDVDDAPI